MPAPASPLALRHRAAPGACAAPDQAAPLQMVWGRGVRRPQRPQRSLQPQRQNLALHVHYERAGGTWTHGYEYAAYTQSPSASAARAGRTASKKRPKWGKRHMRQSNPKAGRAPLLLTRAVGDKRALWARTGNTTGRAAAPPTTLNFIRQEVHSRPGAPSAPQPPRMWQGCLSNPLETPIFTKLSRLARRRACQRIHRFPPPRVSSPHCPPTRTGASRRQQHHRTKICHSHTDVRTVQRPTMRPQARPTDRPAEPGAASHGAASQVGAWRETTQAGY